MLTNSIKECLFIFAICLIFYISITNGTFWEYDSNVVYQLSKSLGDSFSLNIDCDWGSLSNSGFCYSKYGLIMSLITLPFYLVEKIALEYFKNEYFFAGFFPSLTNSFITSLLVVLMYKMLKKMGFSIQESLVGSTLFAFFTYIPTYTKTLFSEPLTTLLIFLSFYVLLFKKDSKVNGMLVGILFGLSILTKVANFIYLPCFLIIFFYKKTSYKNIAYFMSSLLFSILLLFIYNFLRFGNVLDTGYRNVRFDYPFFKGIVLHLFSSGKGIFIYQPFVIFGLLSINKVFRINKLFIALSGYFFLSTLLFYAVYMDPVGDWAWGDRYLYPTLFLLIPLVVYFIKYNSNSILKKLFILCIVLSLLIQIPSWYVSYHRYYAFHNYINNRGKFLDTVYFNPIESPILGQYRILFNLGFSESNKRAVRESFQEYTSFNLDYRLAPTDIFFLRSKKELSFLIILYIIELAILYKAITYFFKRSVLMLLYKLYKHENS